MRSEPNKRLLSKFKVGENIGNGWKEFPNKSPVGLDPSIIFE
jgi:hypothetical protein